MNEPRSHVKYTRATINLRGCVPARAFQQARTEFKKKYCNNARATKKLYYYYLMCALASYLLS